MPEVRPFRAIRYSQDAIDDLSAALAPPYDIISPEQHHDLATRHPHNITRITLGEPSDPPCWHSVAAERMATWLRNGVLVRDETPCFYAYTQVFTHPRGGRLARTAVLGMVRLTDFDKREVRPHERTHSGPKLDRLRLMRTTVADVSPIFAFHDAPEPLKEVVRRSADRPPVLRAVDENGVAHELRRIADTEDIGCVTRGFAGDPIYIADGHHRYETALTFMREVTGTAVCPDDDAPANYVLMAMVAMDDPALVVLPAHRLVRVQTGRTSGTLVDEVRKTFPVERLDPPPRLPRGVPGITRGDQGQHHFALYVGDGQWYRVGVPRRSPAPSPVDSLDVVALQRNILHPCLDIDAEELDRARRIAYTQDPTNGVSQVDQGKYDALFLVRPPAVSQVQQVADAGQYMPQKGTYFYPKLVTGMVLADLREW